MTIRAASAEALTVAEQIMSGQELTHNVRLTNGNHWRIAVEEQGIDIVFSLSTPEGMELGPFNSPLPLRATESALFEAQDTGTYTINIKRKHRGDPAGRVRIVYEALEQGTPRFRAEEAKTQASRLYASEDPAQRGTAIDAYRHAAEQFAEAERPLDAADATYSAAAILNKMSRGSKEALDVYTAALSAYEEIGNEGRMALVWDALGVMYSYRGSGDVASDLLSRAVQQQTILGREYEAAIAQNHLCLVRHLQEQLDSAEACYGEVRETFKRLNAVRFDANVFNSVGGLYTMRGEPAIARQHYDNALRIFRELNDPEGEAHTLNNLAIAYRNAGEIQTALGLYREILGYWTEVDDKRRQARILNNMGYAYLGLGDIVRAQDYLLRSLDLRRDAGDRGGEAVTLNNLGSVERILGHPVDAFSYHQQAAAIARDAERTRTRVNAIIGLGRIQLETGDPNSALAFFGLALHLLTEETEHRGKYDEALHHMGVAFHQIGNIDAALVQLGEALTVRQKVSDLPGQAETLFALAQVLAETGNDAAALANLDEAMSIIESIRSDIVSAELRAQYLATERGVYDLTIDLLMRRHAVAPDEDYHVRALDISERARARTLVELIAETGAEIEVRADPETKQKEQELRHQFSAKTERRKWLAGRAENDAQVVELDREIRRLLDEFEQLQDLVRESNPEYASLLYPQPLTGEQIQSLLDEDSVLLQYALGEPRSYLWVIDRESIEAFELSSQSIIEAAALEFHETLKIYNPRDAAQRAQDGSRLAQLVLAPAIPSLEQRHLIIAPDGALDYIPFGALEIPGTDTGSGQTPLLTKHEIAYLPSATALKVQRDKTATQYGEQLLAILADPVFNRHDPRLPELARAGDFTLGLRVAQASAETGTGQPSGFEHLERLPATAFEAEQLAALVPEDRLLKATGFDATRELLTSGRLAGYRILHFATHGLIDTQFPQFSGLALSAYDASGSPIPAFLSMGDLYNLSLNAELVVLSACDTALGRQVRGEGLVGLTRGFMYAGSRRVVASLWQVDDRATGELMRRFYQAMLEHDERPSAALREAQLAIMQEPGWQDPYYWGAFVLQGEWQ